MNQITLHELKSGLVFRRLILGFLWAFSLFTGIYNCIISIYRILFWGDVKHFLMLTVSIFFCLIPYWTRHGAYRNIVLTYQCFPNLNRLLSVSQQKKLLSDTEAFRPIEELGPIHLKSGKWDRMESAHWLRIKGYYISKELLIGVNIQNTRGNLRPYRKSTYLHFLYVNGEGFEVRLEDALHRDERQNYQRYFAKHCGTTSYLSDRKLIDSINKTYCKFQDDYAARMGYASREETIIAIAKGGSQLQEHIRTKYSHFWEREKERYQGK